MSGRLCFCFVCPASTSEHRSYVQVREAVEGLRLAKQSIHTLLSKNGTVAEIPVAAHVVRALARPGRQAWRYSRSTAFDLFRRLHWADHATDVATLDDETFSYAFFLQQRASRAAAHVMATWASKAPRPAVLTGANRTLRGQTVDRSIPDATALAAAHPAASLRLPRDAAEMSPEAVQSFWMQLLMTVCDHFLRADSSFRVPPTLHPSVFLPRGHASIWVPMRSLDSLVHARLTKKQALAVTAAGSTVAAMSDHVGGVKDGGSDGDEADGDEVAEEVDEEEDIDDEVDDEDEEEGEEEGENDLDADSKPASSSVHVARLACEPALVVPLPPSVPARSVGATGLVGAHVSDARDAPDADSALSAGGVGVLLASGCVLVAATQYAHHVENQQQYVSMGLRSPADAISVTSWPASISSATMASALQRATKNLGFSAIAQFMTRVEAVASAQRLLHQLCSAVVSVCEGQPLPGAGAVPASPEVEDTRHLDGVHAKTLQLRLCKWRFVFALTARTHVLAARLTAARQARAQAQELARLAMSSSSGLGALAQDPTATVDGVGQGGVTDDVSDSVSSASSVDPGVARAAAAPAARTVTLTATLATTLTATAKAPAKASTTATQPPAVTAAWRDEQGRVTGNPVAVLTEQAQWPLYLPDNPKHAAAYNQGPAWRNGVAASLPATPPRLPVDLDPELNRTVSMDIRERDVLKEVHVLFSKQERTKHVQALQQRQHQKHLASPRSPAAAKSPGAPASPHPLTASLTPRTAAPAPLTPRAAAPSQHQRMRDKLQALLEPHSTTPVQLSGWYNAPAQAPPSLDIVHRIFRTSSSVDEVFASGLMISVHALLFLFC